MRVCVRACACVFACFVVCLCARACTACVNELCVRAPRGSMRTPIARRRRAVLMARPAPRVGGRARVIACHRPGSCASAAGVTWTSRTLKAEWAGRFGHTSVIDAAGTIYVIGGEGHMFFQDVWASTDGGARPDYVQGGMVGGYPGARVQQGYSEVIEGY
jgi:hypothetical protein